MGEHRANAARFLEVRTTRRSTMPRMCVEDALKAIDAREQGSYRRSHRDPNPDWNDDEYDEYDFSAPWNGQGSAGVPQRLYAPRGPSSMRPSGRASSLSPPFDQDVKGDHELERKYTQAEVESMQKDRESQWQEYVLRERQEFQTRMQKQQADEGVRQEEAVGNAIQAVEQKAREEFDKQHGEYVKELDAYKEMAAREKDKMEKTLKAQNNELGRQIATLTAQVRDWQLRLSEPSKPQNQGSAPAHPPPPAKQSTPAPPAPPPVMYTVADVPPMMPAGYPALQTAKSGTSSSPYLEAFFLSGESQPKYGPFLLHLADLNDWDLKPKSKAGGAALTLASGATEIVSGIRAWAGKTGSYVDMAYSNNLGDFGESPNHSLEGNAAKANMYPQNYMLEHWKRFQATGSIFLVKAKAGETIYVATSLSLARVSVRHEVNCLYQIGGSDTIEPRTISTDEIQFYAALQVDKDVMERWFQCAQFPEEFTTSWNSSVDVIQETVYRPSNQPALGFLKK